MDLRMAKIDGQVREIISENEYRSKWRMYSENPSMYSEVAVEIEDDNGDKYALPFRGKIDDRPGIYPDGCIYFIKVPSDEESKQEYRSSDIGITDFSDVSTVKEFLAKNGQIREMETNVLTDIDSVFVPQITQSDSPEMRTFKEAIAAKHIDINKYSQRFGPNFLNDKRILKTDSITMKKLVSMCQKLDIEAELTLRNTNPDVPNPMPEPISVILTGSGGDDI